MYCALSYYILTGICTTILQPSERSRVMYYDNCDVCFQPQSRFGTNKLAQVSTLSKGVQYQIYIINNHPEKIVDTTIHHVLKTEQ